MKKAVWKNLLQALGAVALLIGVWVAVWAAVGNEFLVPSFSDCLKEFFGLFVDGGFWKGFSHTLLRVLLAFSISLIMAAALAVVSYLLPAFGRFFAPIVSVLRCLPVLAVLLVILVWTNAGAAPVIVAFLSLFPLLYTGILSALKGVDKALIEMSRVYRVPLKTQILSLYLPSVAPHALRESGAALAFAVKLVVSAEVLARTAGSLGNTMQEAQILSEMPLLFALVIAACLTGLMLEFLVGLAARAVERRVK